MSRLFVVDVTAAPASLHGKLQRMLLEIRAGTFVGKVPGKVAKALWTAICNEKCSAIGIFAANNEAGFVIAAHGDNAREIVDNYGISLISYTNLKSRQPRF